MSRKLYVGNIPYETNETGPAGALRTGRCCRNGHRHARPRYWPCTRGFAFVEMASDDDAQKAIAELNDHQFGGRRLTVNEARPQVPRSGGGGGGGYGSRGPSRRSEPRW